VILTPYNGRRSGNYLFGRLFDKTCFAFLTATFYWRTGAVMDPANAPNLAGLLFMWCVSGLPVLQRAARCMCRLLLLEQWQNLPCGHVQAAPEQTRMNEMHAR